MESKLVRKVQELYKNKAKWKEGLHLEFKRGQNGVPGSLWETYSAFANTGGGLIVVGTDDNGDVVGVPQAETKLKDIVNNINNPGKCSVNLCAESGRIAILALDGKDVIVLDVPAATPEQKPVFLNNNPYQCYVRQHEGDYKCKDQVVQRMLRDRDTITSKYSADAEILPNTGLDDLDKQTIRQFRNRLRSGTPTNTWVDDDDEDLLRKLGAIRKDRESGKQGLTLAGLLMFGKPEAIQELCPFFKIDYFEYADTNENEHQAPRWIDRVTIDGSWASNLYQFFFRVLPLLTKELKRPFKLSSELTRVDEPPAHVAVREALANAIIHADYREKFGICIIKRPTGLELTNAGTLLLSKQQLFEGGFSFCRNKMLQRMFKLMGVVDEAGSGVDKIVKGWAEECLCLPEVFEDLDIPHVTWRLSYLSLVPRRIQEAQRRFMGNTQYDRLSTWEKILLLLMPADQYVSSRELRDFLPIHQADMSRMLSKLRDNGYLQDSGKSNAKRYCLEERLGQQVLKAYQENKSSLQNSKQVVLKSGFMAPKDDFMAPKDDFMALKSDFMASREPVLSAQERVAKELNLPWQLEAKITEYRQKERQSPEVTMSLVIEICRNRWVTAVQLSILLDRAVRPLRKNFLQPAILCRKLEHRHPDSHKNKNQAYRTIE